VVAIRHKETGTLLHQLESDTLAGVSLRGMNLCGASLTGADLSGADLSDTIFGAADLREADLTGANLRGAYFGDADLSGANLRDALMFLTSLDRTDLTGANLAGANLTGSYLAETKLVRATLTFTNLQSTYLGGADLTRARIAFTLFAHCPSLHEAAGLGEIEHLGPSSLDLSTLRAGAASLPDAFLRGAGVLPAEIERLSVLASRPTPYSSCLLLHDPADRELADRLRVDLIAHGVNCWPHCADLGAGYVMQVVFDHAMKRHDRWVFICSEASLMQPDLQNQLLDAIERERQTGMQRIFPVRVDDFVFGEELLRTADGKVASGEWRVDWVRQLRERFVPDFRHWTQAGTYRTALAELLDRLRYRD
jgi:hypothetical protein